MTRRGLERTTRAVHVGATALAAALVCAGCGIGALGGAVTPRARPAGSVEAAGMRPLLVDWGPNDRALLNTSCAAGPLVVRYRDGAMEPLFSCHAKGRYAYTSEHTVQVQDDIIETADELHAKMPAFGAKFSGQLARDGKLHVRMMVVGTYAADQPYFKASDVTGDCASATHIASHVTVGAFRLFSLARGQLQGDVAIGAAEGGGTSRAEAQNLNSGGDEGACAKASAADGQPPDGCTTSLQLVLTPLLGAAEAPADLVHRDTAGTGSGAWSGQKTAAVIAGGVGVLGVGLGAVFGLSASSKWDQAKRDCGAGCAADSPAGAEKSDAQSAAALSTVGFAVGGVALAAGAVLWLTAKSGSGSNGGRTGSLGVAPAAEPKGAGARLYGEF